MKLMAHSGAAPDSGVSVFPETPGEIGYPSGARIVEWVAETGRAVVERTDGGIRTAPDGAARADLADVDLTNARTLLLPLRVHGHTVGVLRLAHAGALPLDAPRRRFLEALSYYAALGVERVGLVADAENAEALRRADEMKNALLASVSHDLRTPLTTITALAHDIAVEGDDRAVTIQEEAGRLNRLVADLLDLSRLAGGALNLAPEIEAADDLVGAALQRVSGTLNGHELNVTLDPADPLLLGRFDFVHSLRILVNLLENALKYSPADSPVELLVKRDDDSLQFVVADRGPGIAPEERERIFEPFYRPATSAPDTGSAGLGLSIAQRLAAAQGGSVRYEPRENGGSLFILRLPAADLSDLPPT
jgi:two-component system sensor histidine kinase KdpD